MTHPRPAGSTDRPNLYGMSRAELAGLLQAAGARPFHADQLFRWLYARGLLDPEDWTDLSKTLRTRLAGDCAIDAPRLGQRTPADDGTIKFRVELPQGGSVESVHMVQSERVTLCISSQVGCALDCDFCLTGRMGLQRQLTPGEIVGQVGAIRADRGLWERPFNVVFMGMGEPLHNYDAVMAAIAILTDPDGFGLSRKRITVSTVGLAPAIERLAREPLRPRLAVSLNATDDAVRDRLMPVNRRYPLKRLLAACREYRRITGEAFTFEYVLLEGVNDREEDARRLISIVRRHGSRLNLIPFNPVPGWLPYRPPARERVLALRDRLLAEGLAVSVRWSRGAGARAGCGQLALLPAREEEAR